MLNTYHDQSRNVTQYPSALRLFLQYAYVFLRELPVTIIFTETLVLSVESVRTPSADVYDMTMPFFVT